MSLQAHNLVFIAEKYCNPSGYQNVGPAGKIWQENCICRWMRGRNEDQMSELQNCEVHLTHIPTPGDEAGLRKLHVNLTCDPQYPSKSLYLGE